MNFSAVAFTLFLVALLAGCNNATSISGNDNNVQATVSDLTLYWSAPLTRVDGSNISQDEIGGYEVRYKHSSDASYETIVISDSSITQYNFESLKNINDYTFEVAVFDTDGLYSEFVTAVSD